MPRSWALTCGSRYRRYRIIRFGMMPSVRSSDVSRNKKPRSCDSARRGHHNRSSGHPSQATHVCEFIGVTWRCQQATDFFLISEKPADTKTSSFDRLEQCESLSSVL